MKKNRIALVVTDFPSPPETFIVRKAAGLIRHGLDVRIACTRSTSENVELLTPAEAALLDGRVHSAWPRRPHFVAALCFPAALASCLISNWTGTLRYLGRGFRESGWRCVSELYRDAAIVAAAPELIHFEFAALAAERPGVARRLGCRMTTSLRGYDMAHVGLEEDDYYAPTWSAIDAAHVLGEHMRALAIERGLDPGRPIYQIPPAVSTEDFDPATADRPTDGPLRLLSVGRAHWTKGYDYALLAARELDRRGVEFVYRIAGGGPDIESIFLARHQLGLEERVEILGMISPDEVRGELAAADIFVHTAVTEGFGNAVLEAQAMGLPVVTSDAGGLTENVQPNRTGLVVPRRDPSALADALEALAGSRERRVEMGQLGRQRVEARFSLDRQIDAFVTMYRDVLGGA